MRVRMLQTRSGRHNMYQAFRYDAGKTFHIPDSMAKLFIERGWAIEDKSLDEAPETKAKPKRKKKIT